MARSSQSAPVAKTKSKSKSKPRSKSKPKRRKSIEDSLHIRHAHAAGIDVHPAVHVVAVPPGSAPPAPRDHPANLPAHVRSFGACTADLEALAEWLRQCGITTVAMESTGVYWVPLFEVLEQRGFEVILVDPRQTRQVCGRPKTDVLDCQWIQRLHSYGLLAASFRPDDQVVVLRSYLRQRQMLIADASRQVQHMQKALEQMNVKLTEVVSDITGLTGMRIIKAILRGQRDAKKLAKYRHERCRRSEAEIARALQGNWRDEHLFALRQAVDLYESFQKLLAECDVAIEKQLKTFADRSGGEELPAPPRKQQRSSNGVRFGARQLLFQMSGVDLTLIEGITENTALVLLSEVGTDVSAFPTEKHFTSWLGLCPNHRGSAGRIRNRGVRRGANRAARALRLAAQGCYHAKNALGAFYRRIQGRCGGPKAVVATARKLAERVYRMLRYGEAYVRQEMHHYEEAYRARRTKALERSAAEMGYKLVPTNAAAP